VGFKIGDKVELIEESKFGFQIKEAGNNKGVITNISTHSAVPYSIKFDNGYTNCYSHKDLRLIGSGKRKVVNVKGKLVFKGGQDGI